MKCPVCGAADLAPGVKTIPFTYKNKSIAFETHADFCPACEEGVLSTEECDRLDVLSAAFRQQVNAECGEPSFIARVRQKLNLDQRQAAELFGGGVNAFSRYERGKTKAPLSLIQLFRILDEQPELLNIVRSSRHSLSAEQIA